MESSASQTTTKRQEQQKTSKRLSAGNKRPCTEEDARIGEALSILKTAVAKQTVETRSNDESSTYGQHVANKLRKYSPRVRDMVQYHINTVLYHADMGNADLQIQPTMSNINSFSVPPYRQLNVATNLSHTPSPRSDLGVASAMTNSPNGTAPYPEDQGVYYSQYDNERIYHPSSV